MRIVVNHLTRMQPGFICVAGIDVETHQHIRPVLNHNLGRELLLGQGGLFDIGAIVDLGDPVPDGIAPEIEDHQFLPAEASYIGSIAPDAFRTLLRAVARSRLTDIFGPDLRRNGGTCSVDSGHGTASLGCLIPQGRPHLYVDGYNSVRLGFSDGTIEVLSAAVTDLRLYEPDHKTPRHAVIQEVADRIDRGVPVLLSVGLARPWQKSGDTQKRHWFQVNNIHLRDDPVWQLG